MNVSSSVFEWVTLDLILTVYMGRCLVVYAVPFVYNNPVSTFHTAAGCGASGCYDDTVVSYLCLFKESNSAESFVV